MSRHAQNIIQTLCLEAADQFGSDPLLIEAYVASRLDGMTEEERRSVKQDIDRILSFEPPAPGTPDRH
jgi:hypothetical protein